MKICLHFDELRNQAKSRETLFLLWSSEARPHYIKFELVYTVGKNTSACTDGNFGGFWGLCTTAYIFGN